MYVLIVWFTLRITLIDIEAYKRTYIEEKKKQRAYIQWSGQSARR